MTQYNLITHQVNDEWLLWNTRFALLSLLNLIIQEGNNKETAISPILPSPYLPLPSL